MNRDYLGGPSVVTGERGQREQVKIQVSAVTAETEVPAKRSLALEVGEGMRVAECWQLLEGGKRQEKSFALSPQKEFSPSNTLIPGQPISHF